MQYDDNQEEITVWLRRLGENHSGALDGMLPLIYQEMRSIARSQLRRERGGHTLSTTGLVHEAYLRFREQHRIATASRAEFFTFASECMRRILVDHARARLAAKRGGGRERVGFAAVDDPGDGRADDSLAAEIREIDLALDRLREVFPRGALVLQCRLFGGLTLEETALALEVSAKTVQRDWTTAIAWLRREVGPTDGLAP